MGISLNVGSLFSRQVRNNLGPRSMRSLPNARQVLRGAPSTVLNFAGRYQGFLVGLIFTSLPTMTWSLTSLWALFTEGAIELYYFDWNQPDERLDAQARARWSAYGGILGGTAGNAIGFFACGVVPSSTLFAFNEELAQYVLREVSEEAFDELSANAAYVIRLTTRNLMRQTMSWAYKNVRRWLKDENNPIGGLLFGDRIDTIREKWGNGDSESWSFAQEVDEQIERIPSQFWQQFTEELIEEAIDGCIEAGYVVTSSVESYYARARQTANVTRGPQRVVEVQPNRANDREKIVLAGYEPEVRAALPVALATHQQIETRDIGGLIGQPLDDYSRARPLGLRAVFTLYSVPSPPYSRRGNNRFVEVSVTVHDVERTRLDWNRLRDACGGQNGYLWGRFRAHAQLDNGHKLSIYGGTETEAEQRLKKFLALSDAKIRTISVTEEKKEGERLRNERLYKQTTRVYPAYVTIINRDRQLALDQGRLSLSGTWIDKKGRIELWRGVEPPEFEEAIRELLRRADSQGTPVP